MFYHDHNFFDYYRCSCLIIIFLLRPSSLILLETCIMQSSTTGASAPNAAEAYSAQAALQAKFAEYDRKYSKNPGNFDKFHDRTRGIFYSLIYNNSYYDISSFSKIYRKKILHRYFPDVIRGNSHVAQFQRQPVLPTFSHT